MFSANKVNHQRRPGLISRQMIKPTLSKQFSEARNVDNLRKRTGLTSLFTPPYILHSVNHLLKIEINNYIHYILSFLKIIFLDCR